MGFLMRLPLQAFDDENRLRMQTMEDLKVNLTRAHGEIGQIRVQIGEYERQLSEQKALCSRITDKAKVSV
jgi:hypothetical protein